MCVFICVFVKVEASACPKWSGSWGSSVFLPTKNLSWGYDLFTINDFYPCGRCNHVFNDYRLFPQIIIRILSEWKKRAFVPVSRFSPLTTGRTILLIYWSLCLIKNTIETLQALCVQHVFFFSLFPLHLYSSSLLPTHRQKNNKGKPQLPRGPSCPSRGNEYGSYLIRRQDEEELKRAAVHGILCKS